MWKSILSTPKKGPEKHSWHAVTISTIFLLPQLGKYWLKHNPVQWVTLSATSEPVLA